MQLTAVRRAGLVLGPLTLLVSGRLGVGAADPARAADTKTAGPVVRTSVEMSGYSDSDAVHVASPTIAGSVGNDARGWSVSGRYLVDAVSAASVDVVATASRKWFEYRHVGSGAVDYKRGDLGVSVSGGVSREPDYLSIGGGATVSMELAEKNVTPSLGLSFTHDDVGRTGQPRSSWQSLRRTGVQAGLTFTIDRSTICSVLGDVVLERGYLAKPYRYVPLFAPGRGAEIGPGASVDEVNQLRLDQRPADQLPAARDRYALTVRLAHRFDGSTLRVDERIYGDNWGVRASTTDARHMIDIGHRLVLWPHGRFHSQSGADFWHLAYEATAGANGVLGVPRYRSGDRELGPLRTITAGAGARLRLTADQHAPWSLVFQLDSMLTSYTDALYLTRRRAIFSALTLEAEWN